MDPVLSDQNTGFLHFDEGGFLEGSDNGGNTGFLAGGNKGFLEGSDNGVNASFLHFDQGGFLAGCGNTGRRSKFYIVGLFDGWWQHDGRRFNFFIVFKTTLVGIKNAGGHQLNTSSIKTETFPDFYIQQIVF